MLILENMQYILEEIQYETDKILSKFFFAFTGKPLATQKISPRDELSARVPHKQGFTEMLFVYLQQIS